MRHRVRVIWGRRAMFGIRIPVQCLPVQPPEFPKPLSGWRHWDNDPTFSYDYENGTHHIGFDIFSTSGERNIENTIILQKLDKYNTGSFDYVIAKKQILDYGDFRYPSNDYHESLEFTTEEIEWCQKLYKFYQYEEDFFDLQGSLGEILLEPYNQGAKTYYHDIDNNYLYMIYSVKWFYPNRKRHFCSAMAKTLRKLEKMNIEYRL